MRNRILIAGLVGLAMNATAFGSITLVSGGKSQCTILAPARVMAANQNVPRGDILATEIETDRQRLRESVLDLSLYLEKLSGASVLVVTNAADVQGIVVRIAEDAEAVFGPVGISVPGGQGYRVVADKRGVGLFGEADLASSYAIYDVLHGLGCRWYMPGELGEVIPELPTVSLAAQDRTGRPHTLYRTIWYADDNYKRRNRMGGVLLKAGHALEGYISQEQREQHPEWRAISGGKPSHRRLKWSVPGVAEALADGIIAQLDKAPGTATVSLSPDDGMGYDETDDLKLDAGDWDSSIMQVSITDRQLWVCNRIIERVNQKHPGIRYGMLAYGPSTRPPLREAPHPQLVPQIAPITFRRAHPMTDDRVPDNKALRDLIEGWAKISPELSYYYYGWFLAEPSAPNPFLTKWAVDVPIAMKNNCAYWQPETVANFETTMHALYMSIRLAWDASEDPWVIYDEINTRFYGQVAPQMKAYWELIDKTWIDVPEYSGCGFGHMRRFPPEALATWRAAMDEALKACTTITEYRRVKPADTSLGLFELFMKLRRDLASGNWATLERDVTKYIGWMDAASDEYAENYMFARARWAWHGSVNLHYFRSFYKDTYDSASLLSDKKKFTILLREPIREFRWQADVEKSGEANGLQRVDFDDADWKTTDVTLQTWSSIGLHDYMGSVWYRTRVKLGALSEGKRIKLWVGATDGSVKVFINGQHVPFIGDEGQALEAANGYCKPFLFDITDAVKANAENTVAIFATRTFINELGIGGLLAPVTIVEEK